MFASQSASATESERAAVRRWQSTDRFYQLVQAVLRGGTVNYMSDVAEVIDALNALLARGELAEDLELWRGVRSIRNTVGVSTERMSLGGNELRAPGFLSTTPIRSVAEGFAEPEGPGGGALLCLTAQRGSRAIWVPPIGDPLMAEQFELVFAPRRRIMITDVDESSEIPMLIGRLT